MTLAAGIVLAFAGMLTMLASMLVDSIPTAYGVHRAGLVASVLGLALIALSGILS